MDTDHELLELAAKAYGLDSSLTWESNPFYEGFMRRNFDESGFEIQTLCWNPITDDGDALRLAVKLQLSIINDHVSSGSVYCEKWFDGSKWTSPIVNSGSNEDSVIPEDYAATRRAIVRAAAEIGRAMP